MKLKDIYTPNQSDIGASEMSFPNVYTNKKIGGSKNIRREKVVIRNSKTGQVVGMRTVVQKNT